MLSARNRVLLFVIWLRMYPTYNLLSNMFWVSVTVVGTEITSLLPVFCEKLDHFLVWPTKEEWRSMLGVWTKLPMAVGAIDGSSDIQTESRAAETVLFRTPALSLSPHSSCLWCVCDNTIHRERVRWPFEWRATNWTNAKAWNWSNISGNAYWQIKFTPIVHLCWHITHLRR